jgi:hypothetical protein
MTRDESLDPILQPWMERNAPVAPDDLLPRVMREVETVSQRTRTWPSLVAFLNVGAWAAAAGVVAMLAVVIGFTILSSSGNPTGGPHPVVTSTPSPTASPTPHPSFPPPTSPQAAIDAMLAAWNAGDVDTVYRDYAPITYLHIVNDSVEDTETYNGREAIAATLVDPARRGCAFIRTGSFMNQGLIEGSGGLLHQDALWAYPFRYVCPGSGLNGFVVLRINQNQIETQWVVVVPTANPQEPVSAPAAVVELLDGCSVWNEADLTRCWAADFEQRLSLASRSGDFTESHSGREGMRAWASAVPEPEFAATRTGPVIQVGDLIAYPFTWATGGDQPNDGINIIRLNAEHTQFLTEWVLSD